jgi:hypothetical protein
VFLCVGEVGVVNGFHSMHCTNKNQAHDLQQRAQSKSELRHWVPQINKSIWYAGPFTFLAESGRTRGEQDLEAAAAAESCLEESAG